MKGFQHCMQDLEKLAMQVAATKAGRQKEHDLDRYDLGKPLSA